MAFNAAYASSGLTKLMKPKPLDFFEIKCFIILSDLIRPYGINALYNTGSIN